MRLLSACRHGLSLEEIAARTMTPPEVLKQYAEENAHNNFKGRDSVLFSPSYIFS